MARPRKRPLPAVEKAPVVKPEPPLEPEPVVAPPPAPRIEPVTKAELKALAPAPKPAPGLTACRHTIMRAGWSSRGKDKSPVYICDECGYMAPRGEGTRLTIPVV